MDMKDSSSDKQRTEVAKKPYEKPAFRHEQVFVTTALACGKITNTQSGCNLNTKIS
jgi:hypothetical protein